MIKPNIKSSAPTPINIISDNFTYVGVAASETINDARNSNDQITTWQGGDSHATVTLGSGTNNTVNLHTFDTLNATSGTDIFNDLNGHDNTYHLGDGTFTATLGGNDSYNAGNGTNTINFASGAANDNINLGNGSNTINFANGTSNDTVILGNGTNTVNFASGATNDKVTVGNGTNTITATNQNGNFTVHVGTGSDTLKFDQMGGGSLTAVQAPGGGPMIVDLQQSTLSSVNITVTNAADLVLTDSSTINSLNVNVAVDGYKTPYTGNITYVATQEAIASPYSTAEPLPYFISNLLFNPVNRWTSTLGAQQTPLGLSFSFMQSSPSYASPEDAKGFAALGPDLPSGYTPHGLLTLYSQGQIRLSAGEVSAISALANWSDIVNVNFVSSTDSNSVYIRFGSNDQGNASAGYSIPPLVPVSPYYTSDSYLSTGSIYLNTHQTNDFTTGGYAGLVFAHEIGHILGQGGETGNGDPHDVLPFGEDSTLYTVESYNSGDGPYGITPMPFDVATSQYLYGPNPNYHPNASHVWTFDAKGGVGNLISDGGGQTNTISAQGSTAAGTIDLRQGHWSFLGSSHSQDVLAPNQMFVDYGTVVTNAVAGSGAMTIVCNENADTVTCGTGGDTVVVAGGAVSVAAGGGGDTMLFADPLSDYNITKSNGQITVTETTTPGRGTLQGTLTLSHIAGSGEALQFSDQKMFVAANEQAAIALLYQGALGRTPDMAGLNYWIGIDNRLPGSDFNLGLYHLSDVSGNYSGNLSIAGGFTNSVEFTQKYGALSNTQFVTQLYANILDRTPDAAGLAGWVAALNSGSTREHVLIGFAESPEAISNATVGFTGQSGHHAAWLIVV